VSVHFEANSSKFHKIPKFCKPQILTWHDATTLNIMTFSITTPSPSIKHDPQNKWHSAMSVVMLCVSFMLIIIHVDSGHALWHRYIAMQSRSNFILTLNHIFIVVLSVLRLSVVIHNVMAPLSHICFHTLSTNLINILIWNIDTYFFFQSSENISNIIV